MLRRAVFICGVGLLLGGNAAAQDVRYFGVWSFMSNLLAEEIEPADRSGRRLGYWAIEFDGEGGVRGGTYHGSDGTPWLSVRYAQVEGRIYANLFDPAGVQRSHKSTNLSTLQPRGPDRH